jgi:hypothetical protein
MAKKPAKKFVANTKAPTGSYAIPPSSPVGGKGVAKYPVNTQKRAKSALSYVGQYGTPTEKKMVYAKVKSAYPALAKRSSVVPNGANGKRSSSRKGKRGK